MTGFAIVWFLAALFTYALWEKREEDNKRINQVFFKIVKRGNAELERMAASMQEVAKAISFTVAEMVEAFHRVAQQMNSMRLVVRQPDAWRPEAEPLELCKECLRKWLTGTSAERLEHESCWEAAVAREEAMSETRTSAKGS